MGRFIDHDLGLTLLPGSQIQREDEKRSWTAAESSPQKPGEKFVGRSERRKSSETEVQQNRAANEAAIPNRTNRSRSSSVIGPDPARLAHEAAPRNGDRPFFQVNSLEDDSEVVRHIANAVTAAPYTEQRMGTREVGSANIYQHNESSLRATKRRKFGSRTSNVVREWTVSKGKEVASEVHHDNQSHVHHGQDLSEVNASHSEERKSSVAAIGKSFSGTRSGLGSSKPGSRRQVARSLDTALARPHQSKILGSEDTVLPGSPSALTALASTSLEKLTVHYQPPNHSKSVSRQRRKFSRLFPDHPADVSRQVLKPRKEVNRSWTSHFPAKAKPAHANLPAPSCLKIPSTSSNHEHLYQINTLLKFTNLLSCTHFPSTYPSSSSTNHLSLPKAFSYPLDVCALEDIYKSAHTGSHRQPARRRSTSMPTLPSTHAPMNMDSSNDFMAASMPTPPHDQPSSGSLSQHDSPLSRTNLVDPSRRNIYKSVNAENYPSQNGQFNSNFPRQHDISLSEKQNPGFTSSLHSGPVLTRSSNHQDTTAPSIPKDEAMATGGPQHGRQRLKIKPFYSHEELKYIVNEIAKEGRLLQVENANLQSLNTAMRKGCESLRNEKVGMDQQIQHYERTLAQKDNQIEAMRQEATSLRNAHTRVGGEYHRLYAILRNNNSTNNASAIAKRIQSNHSSNAVGAASLGRLSRANASPAQVPFQRPGFEQTRTGFQEQVQQLPLPACPEANLINSSSRSSQQAYAPANHNNANPSQTVSVQADVTKTLSQALVQPRLVVANHNSANLPREGSTAWVPSDQSLGTTVRTATTNGQNNDPPMQQVPTKRVTIDLTHDFQPPSSSASHENQTSESSIQGGYQPFNLPPGQDPPVHYPAGHIVSSQYPFSPSAQNQSSQSQTPLDQDSQGEDLEAMQIQKEEYARMAKKDLYWLQGENPHRPQKENPYLKARKTVQQVELSDSRSPSPGNAEDNFTLGRSPKAGSIAPLPETATGRKTKKKVPKTKVALTIEEQKERAKGYRKTAAEKKKREKEQLLQDKNISSNAMRAQKQDRRAAKGAKRQEQARKPLEKIGPHEPQKTIDGRLYRKGMHGGSLEQAASDDDPPFGDDGDDEMEVEEAENSGTHAGSLEQAASDDDDPLFGDDGDDETEVEEVENSTDVDSTMGDHDDAAASDAQTAAELEAMLELDADAPTTRVERHNSDSEESEESEEE